MSFSPRYYDRKRSIILILLLQCRMSNLTGKGSFRVALLLSEIAFPPLLDVAFCIMPSLGTASVCKTALLRHCP